MSNATPKDDENNVTRRATEGASPRQPAAPGKERAPRTDIRLAVFDPEHYPEDAAVDALQRLLDEPKDSATIHYDEDTIPHGACSDPIHCDCMCPECWQLKADIIRRVSDLGRPSLLAALRAIRAYCSPHFQCTNACNGGDDGPCDCEGINPRDVVDAAIAEAEAQSR